MDYDKLIDRLNTKLQSYAPYTDSEFAHVIEDAALAIETLCADLARVTAERDAAVEQLHGICSACQNYLPYHNRGKCRVCAYEPARDKDAEVNDNWKWRGQKED